MEAVQLICKPKQLITLPLVADLYGRDTAIDTVTLQGDLWCRTGYNAYNKKDKSEIHEM